MIYRITWADRLRAAWNRTPRWVIEAILIAVAALGLFFCSGCSDTTPGHGTAMEAAADANARAASNARAADQAAIDAADAKAAADQLTAEAKANPTQALIDRAVEARLDAAVKKARADALDEQSQKATTAAEKAQQAARLEHDAELKAADDRAWTHFCRIIGLIGVATGVLIGGILGYLTKSVSPGAPIGAIIAGTGMAVVAYGSTVSWLPLVLAATVVVGLLVWVLTHRKDQMARDEGLRTGDDAIGRLEAMGKVSVEAAQHALAVKSAAAERQIMTGIKSRVERALSHVRAPVAHGG